MNRTNNRGSSNWRQAAQKHDLTINDKSWPELPMSGNKKVFTGKKQYSKLHDVDNEGVLSRNLKSSLSIDPPQENSNATQQNFDKCGETSSEYVCQGINDIVTGESYLQHTSSEDRNMLPAKLVNSNFGYSQKQRDEIVYFKQIKDSGRKEHKNECKRPKEENKQKNMAKKTDQSAVMINDNNFLGDRLSLEFPALDINQKKINSKIKSGITYKLFDNDNRDIKQSLDNKVKIPKAKDPICINILEAISTVSTQPKLIRRKFEAQVLSNPAVGIYKLHKKKAKTQENCFGNPLDSDKPHRKRGKVHPNKKVKLTLLKAVILKKREEKLKAKEAAKKRLFESKAILLDDVMLQLQTNSVGFKENSVVNMSTNFREKDSQEIFPFNERRMLPLLSHTRKFREYCDNFLSKELIQSVSLLVETVVRFQDRQYARDPIKAHAKRRYVVGLREAKKYIKMKRVRLLIIAPDLEYVSGKGGLDDMIKHLKSEAEIQNLPYLFGPSRRQLGKFAQKNVLVSCLSILSYEGAEEYMSKVLEHLLEARKKYRALMSVCENKNETLTQYQNSNIDSEDNKNLDTEVIASLLEKLKCSDRDVEEIDLKKCNSSPFLMAIENVL